MATQTARILRALERGPVTPVDFGAPDVIDGGKPIMRVAARIQDLRDRGYQITTSTAPNGIAIYEMEAGHGSGRENTPQSQDNGGSSAVVPSPRSPQGDVTTPQGDVPQLFDSTEFAPRRAYGHWEEAA